MAMRSGKDIRGIVEEARSYGKQVNRQSTEGFYSTNPEQARKMALLQDADKETVEVQQKKLFATR